MQGGVESGEGGGNAWGDGEMCGGKADNCTSTMIKLKNGGIKEKLQGLPMRLILKLNCSVHSEAWLGLLYAKLKLSFVKTLDTYSKQPPEFKYLLYVP